MGQIHGTRVPELQELRHGHLLPLRRPRPHTFTHLKPGRRDFLIGSSVDPDIVAQVFERVRGKKALVILDSDHTKEHVLKEIRAYAPLVEIAGYLIVQDTMVGGRPVLPDFGPGPMEAVEEFLASTNEFEPDRSRERLLHTMHPKGYLRRLR